MKHLTDKFEIPELLISILKYIEESTEKEIMVCEKAWEAAAVLFDLSPSLLNSYFSEEYTVDYFTELNYDSALFEFTSFSVNGGDGIYYGWLNLTPELNSSDYPCAVFSPYPESIQWIGRNSKEGLAWIMNEYLTNLGTKNPNHLSERECRSWQGLSKILEIDHHIVPDFSFDLLTVLNYPKGYIYKKTLDGVGVMAPKEAFDSKEIKSETRHINSDIFIHTEELIERGYYGSALVLLKNARYSNPSDKALVQQMVRVYMKLGRDGHALRGNEWLRRHSLVDI